MEKIIIIKRFIMLRTIVNVFGIMAVTTLAVEDHIIGDHTIVTDDGVTRQAKSTVVHAKFHAQMDKVNAVDFMKINK